MTDLSVTPRPEIARDRWDRPLVVPPEGGKPIPYTRTTTFVGSIEDTYNLSRWQQRMVAIGMASRPDLVLSAAAHREDRDKLNEICEVALEAAAAHGGANIGTALHSITETFDRGQDVGVIPEAYRADLEAYIEATRLFTATHIEQFCVQDPWRIGGTPDRVVAYDGKRYIADLKTGELRWGYLKIAAQLAVYARSKTYDVMTHERSTHGAEMDRGIVIHLPAGSGECHLYWVDLVQGWEAVKLCRQVRGMRSMSLAQIMKPFNEVLTPFKPTDPRTAARTIEDTPLPDMPRRDDDPVPADPVPSVPSVPADSATATDVTGQGHYTLTPNPVRPQPASLEDRIIACRSRDEVTALWRDNAAAWTPALTELAKRHIAALNH